MLHELHDDLVEAGLERGGEAEEHQMSADHSVGSQAAVHVFVGVLDAACADGGFFVLEDGCQLDVVFQGKHALAREASCDENLVPQPMGGRRKMRRDGNRLAVSPVHEHGMTDKGVAAVEHDLQPVLFMNGVVQLAFPRLVAVDDVAHFVEDRFQLRAAHENHVVSVGDDDVDVGSKEIFAGSNQDRLGVVVLVEEEPCPDDALPPVLNEGRSGSRPKEREYAPHAYAHGCMLSNIRSSTVYCAIM